MDATGISAAMGALKGAIDVTKGIVSLKNQTEIQAKSIELNSKLIEAQQAIFAINEERQQLLDRIGVLEAQLKSLNNWNSEKEKYVVKSPWPGTPVSVYHLRKLHANGEEPHWLCPNCFQGQRKSILNTNQKRGEHVHLVCSVCKASIDTGFNHVGEAQYAEDIER